MSKELRSALNINNRAGDGFRNINNNRDWAGFREVNNGRSSRFFRHQIWVRNIEPHARFSLGEESVYPAESAIKGVDLGVSVSVHGDRTSKSVAVSW